MDAYSKWLEIEQVHSPSTGVVISKLRKMFAMHGLPRLLVSDNGTAFVSGEFKGCFLKKMASNR